MRGVVALRVVPAETVQRNQHHVMRPARPLLNSCRARRRPAAAPDSARGTLPVAGQVGCIRRPAPTPQEPNGASHANASAFSRSSLSQMTDGEGFPHQKAPAFPFCLSILSRIDAGSNRTACEWVRVCGIRFAMIRRHVLPALLLALVLSVPLLTRAQNPAPTPPLGWNSWDAYGLTINEDRFPRQRNRARRACASWLGVRGHR